MFPSGLQPTLERVASRWDQVEAIVKRAENLTGDAVGATMFELRYAGRKLVDTLRECFKDDPDPALVVKLVAEVEENCDRAQHDAVDAIIFYLRENLRHNEEIFGPDLLLDHWASYLDTKATLNRIGEVVVSSRQFRGERVAIYNRMENEDIPLVLARIAELEQSEAALKALFERRSAEDASQGKESLKSRYILVFTIIAVIVGLVAIAVAHFDAQKEHDTPKVEKKETTR